MEPADNQREGKSVPKGGEPHPVLLLFAPFGDDKRVSVTIRRFHSLRSFHQRLFTFAPFGDGRMLLVKLQLSILICSFLNSGAKIYQKLHPAKGKVEKIGGISLFCNSFSLLSLAFLKKIHYLCANYQTKLCIETKQCIKTMTKYE